MIHVCFTASARKTKAELPFLFKYPIKERLPHLGNTDATKQLKTDICEKPEHIHRIYNKGEDYKNTNKLLDDRKGLFWNNLGWVERKQQGKKIIFHPKQKRHVAQTCCTPNSLITLTEGSAVIAMNNDRFWTWETTVKVLQT